MKYFRWCVFAMILLVQPSIYACSLGYAKTFYTRKGKVIEYTIVDFRTGKHELTSRLEHVNLSNFRSLKGIKPSVVDGNQTWFASGYFTDDNDIFYNGKRLVSPLGPVKVSMFKELGVGTSDLRDQGYVTDGVSIFLDSSFITSAQGFEVISTKSAYIGSCTMVDHIFRNHEHIIVGGVELPDADPRSFRVIRWVPYDVLEYRDKNGKHVYKY